MLLPSLRSVLPATTLTASTSCALATTETFLVNGASSKVPLSATVTPFTVNSERLVFEDNGATTALNEIVLVVFKSPAVTITSTVFSPTTRPVRPRTFTVAAASRVTATTFTDVVLAGSWITSPLATAEPFTVSEVRVVSEDAPPTRTVKT